MIVTSALWNLGRRASSDTAVFKQIPVSPETAVATESVFIFLAFDMRCSKGFEHGSSSTLASGERVNKCFSIAERHSASTRLTGIGSADKHDGDDGNQ